MSIAMKVPVRPTPALENHFNPQLQSGEIIGQQHARSISHTKSCMTKLNVYNAVLQVQFCLKAAKIFKVYKICNHVLITTCMTHRLHGGTCLQCTIRGP